MDNGLKLFFVLVPFNSEFMRKVPHIAIPEQRRFGWNT